MLAFEKFYLTERVVQGQWSRGGQISEKIILQVYSHLNQSRAWLLRSSTWDKLWFKSGGACVCVCVCRGGDRGGVAKGRASASHVCRFFTCADTFLRRGSLGRDPCLTVCCNVLQCVLQCVLQLFIFTLCSHRHICTRCARIDSCVEAEEEPMLR